MKKPILLICLVLPTLTLAKTAPLFPYDLSLLKQYDNDQLIPIAIVGSGPAGLSASRIAAEETRLRTVVFSGYRFGGPLNSRTPIGNWPGIRFTTGNKIIETLAQQASFQNVEFISNSIKQVDFSRWPFKLITNNQQTFYAISLILAAGTQPKRLKVPGEDIYFSKGVTFDELPGPSETGKHAIVVGGGIDAVNKVINRLRVGMSVTLVVRDNELNCQPWRKDKLSTLEKANKLSIHYQSTVKSILGDGKQATGVLLDNGQILHANHIIIAIGREPKTQQYCKYLHCDDEQYIQLQSQNQQTSIPGIFAAGEISNNNYGGQAAISSSNGMKAAFDAVSFLKAIKYL